jgi:hypothetical protein
MQNKRQNYNSVYLNIYIFGQQTGGQKTLHRMRASIPSLLSALNFFLNIIIIIIIIIASEHSVNISGAICFA